jgi:hypothetical protein
LLPDVKIFTDFEPKTGDNVPENSNNINKKDIITK